MISKDYEGENKNFSLRTSKCVQSESLRLVLYCGIMNRILALLNGYQVIMKEIWWKIVRFNAYSHPKNERNNFSSSMPQHYQSSKFTSPVFLKGLQRAVIDIRARKNVILINSLVNSCVRVWRYFERVRSSCEKAASQICFISSKTFQMKYRRFGFWVGLKNTSSRPETHLKILFFSFGHIFQAVKKNPYDYDCWFDLIRLIESEGDIEAARSVYERAVANTPLEEVTGQICFCDEDSCHYMRTPITVIEGTAKNYS